MTTTAMPDLSTPDALRTTAADFRNKAAWYNDLAYRYEKAADLVAGATTPTTNDPGHLSPSMQTVYDTLNGEPVTIRQMRTKTNLSGGTISGTLHLLQKRGLVRRVGRGIYQRVH